MAVRFYVDANLLGLAHILADLRSDLTYPGIRVATSNDESVPRAQSKAHMFPTASGYPSSVRGDGPY